MKKQSIIVVAGVYCVALSGAALAYGGMSNTASAMSSGRMSSGTSFSINIKVPYNMTLQPESGLPISSGSARYMGFDATQVPVHELPPLPLTLDASENDS